MVLTVANLYLKTSCNQVGCRYYLIYCGEKKQKPLSVLLGEHGESGSKAVDISSPKEYPKYFLKRKKYRIHECLREIFILCMEINLFQMAAGS